MKINVTVSTVSENLREDQCDQGKERGSLDAVGGKVSLVWRKNRSHQAVGYCKDF